MLAVELATFTLRGRPRPRFHDELALAWVGHLAGDPPGADDLLRSAYAAQGAGLSRDLLGQYAAVVVDRRARRVLLVQDSLGLRTLYHTLSAGWLIVADTLPQIADRLPDPVLDEGYFAAFLARGTRPFGHTPLLGIHRLSGGSSLSFSQDQTSRLRPWQPAAAASAAGDAPQRLRDLLDEAVHGMRPGGAAVACELSGGLDSSSVFATARRAGPVHALTLMSGSGQYDDDDETCAALMARDAASWQRLDLDRHPPFSVLPDRIDGEPGGEMRLAIQRGYSAALVAVGAQVVLTGIGGDVVFGYGGLPPFHIGDGLAAGHPGATLRQARNWASATGGNRPWTYFLAHYGLQPAWRHWRRRSLVAALDGPPPRWLSSRFLLRHGQAGPPVQPAPRLARPGRQYLWESLYAMANDEAASGFRIALPAQTRHPLLHRPLAEFLLSLPPEARALGADDRRLQRLALIGRLPDPIRTRATKGGDQRVRERAQAQADPWMRLMTEAPRLVARGWVEPAGWAAQLARARFGLFDGLASFDAAMCTEMWLRCWESRVPVRPDLLDATGTRAGFDAAPAPDATPRQPAG